LAGEALAGSPETVIIGVDYFCWGLQPYALVYIAARVVLCFFLEPSPVFI